MATIAPQHDTGVYAAALIRTHPHLRLGVVTEYGPRTSGLDADGAVRDGQPMYEQEVHFFAHDDEYAYDEHGRHSLPYTAGHTAPKGRGASVASRLDVDPEEYGSEVPVRDFWFTGPDGPEVESYYMLAHSHVQRAHVFAL